MEDKDKIKKEIEEVLEKIKYRIGILKLIEEKLMEMKILAQMASEELPDEDRKIVVFKICLLSMFSYELK